MFSIKDSYYIDISNYIGYRIKDIIIKDNKYYIKFGFLFKDEYNLLSSIEKIFEYNSDMLIYHRETEHGLDSKFITSILGNNKEILPDIIKNIKNKLNNN